MANKHTVIYMGGFELPDKNAAAHRVVGNAKAFREIGFDVVLVGITNTATENDGAMNKSIVQGFDSYTIQYPKYLNEWLDYLINPQKYIYIINKYSNTRVVVLYNFQSIVMHRIIKYCKTRGIKCIADVTEWYQPGGTLFHKLIKSWDTSYRMEKVNLECDGLIAISKYLADYYDGKIESIIIPPLVDVYEKKWNVSTKQSKEYVFNYVGKPSDRKERLDLIIHFIERLPVDKNEIGKKLLCVAGVTQKEYEVMYHTKVQTDRVKFVGRVSHQEALNIVGKSHWSIVIRNRTRVVEAGFPTKVTESLTCGVPVIANKFSNIEDFLNEENSILLEEQAELANGIDTAYKHRNNRFFDRSIFDYRHYSKVISDFLSKIIQSNW